MALTALMAEWSRTDINYTTRVGHLNGTIATGGRNASFKLNASTIVVDDAIDTFDMTNQGATSLDWFIASTLEQDNDKLPTPKTVNGVTEIQTIYPTP
jgi:hypothetical protein